MTQTGGGSAATPTATPPPAAVATQPPSPTAKAGTSTSYIVKFAPGTTAAQQSAALVGATAKRSVPQLGLQAVTIPAAALQGIQRNPRVLSVTPDVARRVATAPDDTDYLSQWALPMIGWDQLYGAAAPAGTASVALLDTGVDATHPDLAGSLVPGTSIIDGSGGTLDLHGHGTAMAGILAAATNNATGVAGVGYAGVRVMPVTVLAADGTGADSDVIAGVVYAADNGAKVILLPFAAPDFSQPLQDAIDYAWAAGAVIVAAGGNDGAATPMYPAGDRGVIGVSSTTFADAVDPASNSGAHIFLGAPGTSIRTTAMGGGYTMVSGSSAASAHVAASAALLRALDPTLTNGVTAGRLAAIADAVGTVATTGNGRLNLARAASSAAITSIQPAGAPPTGAGGPFVGPYVVQADTITGLDLDTGNGGNALTFQNSGANARACNTRGSGVPGTVAINFQGANGNHFAAGTVLTYTFSAPAGVTLTSFAPSNVPATWVNESSFSVTFNTTVPAALANGTYTVNVTVAGSQVSSGTLSLTSAASGNLAVNCPNAAPVASPVSVTTLEDTATSPAITLTGTDSDGNNTTFAIVTPPTAAQGALSAISAPTCGSVTPRTCTATVTFTPATNFNGPTSFSYRVNDGTVDSPPATVSITVTPVNDAPTFTKGADQTVVEDAGAQSVPGWATAISPGGGSDEAGQAVTFSITANTNPGLFSAAPAVSTSCGIQGGW